MTRVRSTLSTRPKKTQLSEKRQVDCILIVLEEVVVLVCVGYVWPGCSVGVRSEQDCLLR